MVAKAREVAESGADDALRTLAVHQREPYPHMDEDERRLRRQLRAHARQLGDRRDVGGQAIDRLTQECAYEHWHGMLFARFLAENSLLIAPDFGVAVTLEECEDLAKELDTDKWRLAAGFAQEMLPQVFRPTHPTYQFQFAREHRARLEELVESLDVEVFSASDSLGWVYQFWQSRRKGEINRSESKIGTDELPAVTQLFTEPYMVRFLLDNSLGAWWNSRRQDAGCSLKFDYLRRRDDGFPAAGEFAGWPDDLSEFRLLDPCCGSGHFLVAAFLMLVPIRMALEGITPQEAVDAVLRQNLHGLELDQRCVAIAAFALALEAWRYPGAGGYRPLPRMQIAWCGQPVGGTLKQWTALGRGDEHMEAGLKALYEAFRYAPVLGSLIDPSRSLPQDMLTAGFNELQPIAQRALEEFGGEDVQRETAIAVLGLADSARLLSNGYHLVATNVPYLVRSKQTARLREFSESRYPDAKGDLANVFLERCLELAFQGDCGVVQVVMPQNWLFLTSYKAQRERLLADARWRLLARLGPGAFDTISGEVVKAILLTLGNEQPDSNDVLLGIDASAERTVEEKAQALHDHQVAAANQLRQLANPDARVMLHEAEGIALFRDHAKGLQGLSPADAPRYGRRHWELPMPFGDWCPWQSTLDSTAHFGGRELALNFGADLKEAVRAGKAYLRGREAWGSEGLVVAQIGNLPCSLYSGDRFDTNCAVVWPFQEADLPAIWCFCSSPEYNKAVRRIDQKLNVTNATLVKVPFDIDHWRGVAADRYPNGLPKPYSDDPTQWIFHGHPCGSVVWDEGEKNTSNGSQRTDETALHVAVARLLGYRWPAENGQQFELADEACAWVERSKCLHDFEDEDGIVCIPAVRGEPTASERLLRLLAAAWGEESWNENTLRTLVEAVDGGSLDNWLRNRFFEQHCKLFRNRPFIWQIWDGRKRDGFHALVNYHKLAEGDGRGRQLLESLAHSYLGDWIRRQQDGVQRGEGGAEGRLAAATELQKRLSAILEGEPPFDIFVRWKPLADQPIGWMPDINDGVRLNIRPFMAQDIPGGKKGAGILRSKPNIHWRKDRGQEPVCEPEQFPWFWEEGEFRGDRVNDVHLRIAEKVYQREQPPDHESPVSRNA